MKGVPRTQHDHFVGLLKGHELRNKARTGYIFEFNNDGANLTSFFSHVNSV
jgi:hypothetical protein